MFILTIVVGLFALIALALPDLVLLGLLLILPGICLMLAPTAFVYLASATAIRSILPNPTGVTSTFLACIAAVLLGYVIAWPFQRMGEREYLGAIQDDVVSPIPLVLAGNIRLERRDITHLKRGQENECDELCAALLLTPGVESVTLVNGKDLQHSTTWQLVPRGSVPDTGHAPTNPEDIFLRYPSNEKLGHRNGIQFHEFQQARRQRLAADWNLRLATRETLLASDKPIKPDTTIVITHIRGPLEPSVQRVEVLDQAGVTLFRRSLVQHAIVSAPFYIAFHPHLSNSRFAIGRSMHSTGQRYESFHPVTELIEHVSGLRQTPSEDAPQRVKQLLVAAINTPEGRPDGLDLADPWIAGLGNRALTDEDTELVLRIVADLRIQHLGDALRRVLPKKAPVQFRSSLVQRIIAFETSVKDRNYYAALLSKMPADTFAEMTDAEWQIINDPTLRNDAVAFVERLADLGKPGVEPLLDILQHAVTTMPAWHQRRATVHAVCRGFARLGTEANEALPQIRALFEERRSPITNSASDAFAWRLAMTRMGLAIDELPYPPSWNEQAISKMRDRVRQRFDDFNPDDEWK